MMRMILITHLNKRAYKRFYGFRRIKNNALFLKRSFKTKHMIMMLLLKTFQNIKLKIELSELKELTF